MYERVKQRALVRRTTIIAQKMWRTGDSGALDTAIDQLRQALAGTPSDYPGRKWVLTNLCAILSTRFQFTGNTNDLEEATAAARGAVAATPPGRRRRALMLTNLSGVLLTMGELTGNKNLLDEAVAAAREAVAATPPWYPSRIPMLANLGAGLRIRFELTGSQHDLDEAIDASREAANWASRPPRDARLAEILSNFALALRVRFELAGSQDDIDSAVRAARAAVAITPDAHPYRFKYLASLNGALMARSEFTGNEDDLDEAVAAGREAVAAILPDHPSRAVLLSNLSLVLRTRFELTGSQDDLDEAVAAGREAVAATPPDHPERAKLRSNLGSVLGARFELTGTQEDIDEAVVITRDAIRATPPGDPYRARLVSNLCSALGTRFKLTGSQDDLDEAAAAGREAVAATPPDHPMRSVFLSNLNLVLRTRFKLTGSQDDLDEAVTAGRDAVAVAVASPRVRAVAARGWGRAAAACERWEEAVAGFEAAIDLLGQVAPRSLSRGNQEMLLEELGTLGTDAAACCIHAGLTNRAAELFEQGRGVLLSQALDARTDVTALSEQYPQLARQFTSLRDAIDKAHDDDGRAATLMDPDGREAGPRGRLAQRAERRQKAAGSLDHLITEIRAMPGFNRFLRPSMVSELLASAADGPIVIVNVSEFGSHALILANGGIGKPLPLPDLNPDSVRDRAVEFLTALDETSSWRASPRKRAAAELQLAETLGWLWDAVAGPVLDHLAITAPPGDDKRWPRLWWCVSGLLSFLPLHAAGHHDSHAEAEPATVIDRVISSYTPTIRTLAQARLARSANPGSVSSTPNRVLVVAMPHTPDATDLPGAETEAAGLQRRFPGQVTVLSGGEATRHAVLREMPTARWAHFSCHGYSDLTDPSASCLLLSDHQDQPLTVVDVARLRLKDSDLAYLSACSTAQPGARLIDESIHLSSAFQLAGYRHVIATLWPIGDQGAVEIADNLYAAIASSGTADTAAVALHTVTRELRNRKVHSPSSWAAYVHSGA